MFTICACKNSLVNRCDGFASVPCISPPRFLSWVLVFLVLISFWHKRHPVPGDPHLGFCDGSVNRVMRRRKNALPQSLRESLAVLLRHKLWCSLIPRLLPRPPVGNASRLEATRVLNAWRWVPSGRRRRPPPLGLYQRRVWSKSVQKNRRRRGRTSMTYGNDNDS